MIEKLTFRDVWGFVGQKGIEGHSTLEEVLIIIMSGSAVTPTPALTLLFLWVNVVAFKSCHKSVNGGT